MPATIELVGGPKDGELLAFPEPLNELFFPARPAFSIAFYQDEPIIYKKLVYKRTQEYKYINGIQVLHYNYVGIF